MGRGRMPPAILLQPAPRLLRILPTHLGGTEWCSMASPAPRWWQFSNLHPETEHMRENSNHTRAHRSPNAFSIPLRSQEPKRHGRTELLKIRTPLTTLEWECRRGIFVPGEAAASGRVGKDAVNLPCLLQSQTAPTPGFAASGRQAALRKQGNAGTICSVHPVPINL